MGTREGYRNGLARINIVGLDAEALGREAVCSSLGGGTVFLPVPGVSRGFTGVGGVPRYLAALGEFGLGNTEMESVFSVMSSIVCVRGAMYFAAMVSDVEGGAGGADAELDVLSWFRGFWGAPHTLEGAAIGVNGIGQTPVGGDTDMEEV